MRRLNTIGREALVHSLVFPPDRCDVKLFSADQLHSATVIEQWLNVLYPGDKLYGMARHVAMEDTGLTNIYYLGHRFNPNRQCLCNQKAQSHLYQKEMHGIEEKKNLPD